MEPMGINYLESKFSNYFSHIPTRKLARLYLHPDGEALRLGETYYRGLNN